MRLPSGSRTMSRAGAAPALFVAVALLLTGCLAPVAEDLAPATLSLGSEGDGDCLRMLGPVDLQTATIADLQTALAAGTITSVQLVDAYNARIAAYDEAGPTTNSVQVVSAEARAL